MLLLFPIRSLLGTGKEKKKPRKPIRRAEKFHYVEEKRLPANDVPFFNVPIHLYIPMIKS